MQGDSSMYRIGVRAASMGRFILDTAKVFIVVLGIYMLIGVLLGVSHYIAILLSN